VLYSLPMASVDKTEAVEYIIPRVLLVDYRLICLDVLECCAIKGCADKVWRVPVPQWVEKRWELQREWIDSMRPMTKRKARRLLKETRDTVKRLQIEYWAGRRGRPIELRQPAIIARMWRHYFDMPWAEITRRFYHWGGKEDRVFGAIRIVCQKNLQRVVGQLNQLLDACKIKLPTEPSILLYPEDEEPEENKSGRHKLGPGYKPGSIANIACAIREGFDRQDDEGRKKFARELVSALPEDFSRLILKEICCRTGMSVKGECLDLHEIAGALKVLFQGKAEPGAVDKNSRLLVELLGPDFIERLGKAAKSAQAAATKRQRGVA